MKIEKLKNPKKYEGLYVIDFGDHSGVGFTGEEVAELLESEKFGQGKVYKIHRAYPDGTLELQGVPRELFELEAGMFFYESELEEARGDYKRLVDMSVGSVPPCRAKVQLARVGEGEYVTALIYPAEYDADMSSWLLVNGYRTAGPARGGVEVVGEYYDAEVEVLERHQLFGKMSFESRTGGELLESAKRKVVQR